MVSSNWLKSILLALLIVSVHACTDNSAEIKAKKIEKDIRETIPLGTDRSEVAKYLSGKNISHSYVKEDEIIYALIDDLGTYFILYESGILFRFHFNELEKLEKIETEMQYSGM